MPTIAEIVNEFLEQKKTEVFNAYVSKGIKSSGKFGQSLKTSVNVGTGKITGKITGIDYSYFLEYGRRPGKRPPIATIEQWIKEKNIPLNDGITVRSLAFIIARKIGNEGTNYYKKNTGIFTDVFTRASFADLSKTKIGYLSPTEFI